MKRLFCILSILLCCGILFAQTQEWVARYNGPVDVVDGGMAVAVDDYGNVYVTGRSGNTPSTFECTTIKYDSSGNEVWVEKYHGPASSGYGDTGWGIAIDKANNIYVTASSRDSLTGDDIAVLKYRPDSTLLWVSRYNGPGDSYDWPFDIAIDSACNVYVTGRSEGSGTGFDYITLKYDSSGNEEWAMRYNGPGNSGDEAYSVAVDDSGNVFTTGTSTGSGTGLDFATIKYDPDGNELWVARYHTYSDMDEFGATLALDGLGNVYVTGGTWKFLSGIPSDYLTVKYNASGDSVWVERYDGVGNDDDIPEEIAVDPFGNVCITGESWGGSGPRVDYLTIQYDSLGNLNWYERYDGPATEIDRPSAIAVDKDGNVYVTGQSEGTDDNDYCSVVYNRFGGLITVQRYDGPNSGGAWQDAPQDICVDPYGNFYVTGLSGGVGTTFDFATVKYSGIVGTSEQKDKRSETRDIRLTCIPNPFMTEIRIQISEVGSDIGHLSSDLCLEIYDLSGRLVHQFSVPSSQFSVANVTWDGTGFAPGIYFISVYGSVKQKIIKLQ
jgi:hypothetical protein